MRRYLAVRWVVLVTAAPFALTVPAAAAGGDSVPADAVATVGGTAITNDAFAHWMTVAATSQQQATSGATSKPTVPEPPEFTECVTAAKAALPKTSPKGKKPPTEAQLKAQCRKQYRELRDQVLQFLISSQWMISEAASRGIGVTDQQVEAEFTKQKRQSYPKESAFRKFLKSSGMTIDDILLRVKVDMLSTKLRRAVVKDAPVPTPAQIKAYYVKHKRQFRTEETRDIKIVSTKIKARAQAAKQALAGSSFEAVARKYSVDTATRNHGGVVRGVTRNQYVATVDKAVFAASKRKVYGPIKTHSRYYLFQVTKITRSTQLTLKQVRPQLTETLTQQNQQKLLDAFVSAFLSDWTAKTDCRSGYVVELCGNAPRPDTSPLAAGF